MRNHSREQIEAVIFKPTAGGFVYRAPLPWVFGQARNYRVNDAQKAEILAIMAPDLPAWRRAAVMAALIVVPIGWIGAVTRLVWALGGHDHPTGGDFLAVLLLALVPLAAVAYFALAWNAQLQLAKLVPILARLEPSGEAITPADVRRGMIRSMSFRALLTIIVLFAINVLIDAFALGMGVAHHRLASLSTALIAVNLVLALVAMAVYVAMLVIKAKRQAALAQG